MGFAGHGTEVRGAGEAQHKIAAIQRRVQERQQAILQRLGPEGVALDARRKRVCQQLWACLGKLDEEEDDDRIIELFRAMPDRSMFV